MVGNWIRPWPGESLVGQILAVSGDRVECRSPGGVSFHVQLADVRAGRVKELRAIMVDDGVVLRELQPRRFAAVDHGAQPGDAMVIAIDRHGRARTVA